MALIESFEADLFAFLMDELKKIPEIKIYGITDPQKFNERIPTVSFRVEGQPPHDTAQALGDEGIYVWDGHCYGYEPIKQLGLLESGGVVRVGLSLYNTREEVERFLTVLKKLV